MLSFRESIRALRLAHKLAHENAPATGEEAREYLALCSRHKDSAPTLTAAAIESLKDRAQPALPLAVMLPVVAIALWANQKALLLFVPVFIFAAYLAWLHRQALERIAPVK